MTRQDPPEVDTAEKRYEAFAAKTRRLYEQAFGHPLSNHDFIVALDQAITAAQEHFLGMCISQIGLNPNELACLHQLSTLADTSNSGSLASPEELERRSSRGPEQSAPKFIKAADDEWMFNFGCEDHGCEAHGCKDHDCKDHGCKAHGCRTHGSKTHGCETH